MTRVLIVLGWMALAAACGPAPSGLAPEAAYQAGVRAVEARDTDRALGLFAEAAEVGHLDALRQLTRAYAHGSLSASGQPGAPTVFLDPSPRRAERLERAYQRALSDSVEVGNPRATLWAAVEAMGLRMHAPTRADLPPEIRERYWDRVDVGAVRALYARLDGADFSGWDRTELARLGLALGDTTGALAVLDRAIAEGDTGACVHKVLALHGPPDYHTAAGLAAHLDQMAACDPALFADGSGLVDTIRQSETPRSAEMIDSLATLGLFDRYPALAASTP